MLWPRAAPRDAARELASLGPTGGGEERGQGGRGAGGGAERDRERSVYSVGAKAPPGGGRGAGEPDGKYYPPRPPPGAAIVGRF